MTRSVFSSTVVSVLLGGLLWAGLSCPAQGQTLADVIRYSQRLPAGSGSVTGQAGAGLSAGLAAPDALFGNPAGLGWLSSSVLSGDLAVNRTRSDTRFTTPSATTAADRTVSDYRLGSMAGAYSFPTTRGSLVIGASFHQSNTYERGFDVGAPNRRSSITGTFLPENFQLDNAGGKEITFSDIVGSLDGLFPRLAFKAGAIDFSKTFFENGNYPFVQGAAINDTSATDGAMTLEQRDHVTESGQANEISLGGAVAIAPNVMLGGGLNITFGSYTFERSYRESDVSTTSQSQICPSGLCPPENAKNPQPPYDPYFVIDSTKTPALVLEGFREIQMEERIEADLSGVNFRFGLSAKPLEFLKVGGHIKSPTWLSVTEVFGTEMRTQFDCNFALNTPCPQGGVEGFSSGNLDSNEFSYNIRTPWRAGIGVQFSTSGFTLAGDATFVDWTQAKVEAEKDRQVSRSTQRVIERLNRDIQELDATVNTRVGLEYATDAFALRTGVAHQPSPTEQSFKSIDGKTVNGDQLFFSVGASVSIGRKSTLHLSWMQERFDDRFASYNSPDGSPTVREALRRNRVLIGFTYRP